MRSLTLSLLLMVLIATIGLGWMFDRLYGQYTQHSTAEKNPAQSSLEQFGQELAINLDGLDDRLAFVQDWPVDGAYSLNIVAMDEMPMPTALLEQLKGGKPLLLSTSSQLAYHYYLPSAQQLLILRSPLPDAGQDNPSLNLIFTLLFYLALILLFLIWITPLVRRLLSLRHTAKAFGEGDLSRRINVGSISYIRDVEMEFNHMAQRIENLVSDVKLLSGAVSHDLRTPLARIRFGIDTLQEEDDPVLRRRFEEKISDNVDEMTSLVETLLDYARLDQAMINVEKKDVDLAALVSRSIQNKETPDVAIEYLAPDSDCHLLGDRAYLSMAVNNLLQNAIQYCKSRICISLTEDENTITLTIADDGPGIPDTLGEQVFQPFVRGEPTRNKVKGHGIGLAIVKRIVDWHQGTVHVDNGVSLPGARFDICLPKF